MHAGEEPSGSRRCSIEVTAQDDVERRVFERELHLLDVADEHLLADVCGRACGRIWIELDADDLAAALDERPREVSARAAHVEHALLSATDELEKPSMTSERARVSWTYPAASAVVTRVRFASRRVASRRNGMVSSARKNAPKTIWIPSPSAGHEESGLVRASEGAEAVCRPLERDDDETDDRERARGRRR